MSSKDLIAAWEEALAVALSQPDGEKPVIEMDDSDLTNVAGSARMRVRSNVVAGLYSHVPGVYGCDY